MLSNGKLRTYQQKLAQADREAKAAVWALLATIVAWIVLGFGLAGLDVQLFHTPLWVLGGTIGTWLFSLGVCVFLERRVFVDFDLDDEESDGSGFAESGVVLANSASTGVVHE